MSFSAVNEETGFYYGADGLGRLFSQKRNMVSPSFYRMLWDLVRFYKKAKQQLDNRDLSITLGDYLRKEGYSASFRDNHIIPMACALWSAPAASIEHFPLHYFLAFMHNHRMLQLSGRPQWKTVKGGSSQYVKKLLTQFKGNVRENTPVIRVRRNPEKAIVFSEPFGEEHFDVVVFACHSDQALRLLQDPSDAEKSILGAIHYQQNHVIVHTDRRFLPPKKSAWASWNARIPKSSQSSCSVSYWMNLLQNLPVETPVIVTLNPETTQVARIKESSILAQRNYSHPIYTKATVEAQQRKSEINGVNRTYYCGAYWGWGFHEDGVRSGLDVVNILERASC